jgi:hypothetical protein
MPVEPQHMQTFQVRAPAGAYRLGTCEEAECEHYARGWKMQIDLQSELGQKQAYYIKHQSGRSFTHEVLPSGLVELVFKGGQPCFREHKIRNDVPDTFLVKGGDARGNPLKTPTRVHKRPEFWVEEFAQNQARIAEVHQRG